MRTDFKVIRLEVHEVTLPVRRITPPFPESLQPTCKREFVVNFHITPANANAAVIDTWEICLAADARAEADIQSVIPDVQFCRIWSVNAGNEVDSIRVSHIHDVLIRADTVKRGHLIT